MLATIEDVMKSEIERAMSEATEIVKKAVLEETKRIEAIHSGIYRTENYKDD